MSLWSKLFGKKKKEVKSYLLESLQYGEDGHWWVTKKKSDFDLPHNNWEDHITDSPWSRYEESEVVDAN